jgi:hypothetical protein
MNKRISKKLAKRGMYRTYKMYREFYVFGNVYLTGPVF